MRESGIYQMYLKNLLDRLLALVGTAALSWLLILLGIAIHLDSPGPIFFRQKRAGKNGTYFYIYKFLHAYASKYFRISSAHSSTESASRESPEPSRSSAIRIT